jgi:hypothetical protein
VRPLQTGQGIFAPRKFVILASFNWHGELSPGLSHGTNRFRELRLRRRIVRESPGECFLSNGCFESGNAFGNLNYVAAFFSGIAAARLGIRVLRFYSFGQPLGHVYHAAVLSRRHAEHG